MDWYKIPADPLSRRVAKIWLAKLDPLWEVGSAIRLENYWELTFRIIEGSVHWTGAKLPSMTSAWKERLRNGKCTRAWVNGAHSKFDGQDMTRHLLLNAATARGLCVLPLIIKPQSQKAERHFDLHEMSCSRLNARPCFPDFVGWHLMQMTPACPKTKYAFIFVPLQNMFDMNRQLSKNVWDSI